MDDPGYKRAWMTARQRLRPEESADESLAVFKRVHEAQAEGRPAFAGSTAPVRVSIALSEREATFLYSLLRDTGEGGPLWDDSAETYGCHTVGTEPNPYTDEERGAARRLLAMLGRATDAHARTAR